jgi:hypothetical protein
MGSMSEVARAVATALFLEGNAVISEPFFGCVLIEISLRRDFSGDIEELCSRAVSAAKKVCAIGVQIEVTVPPYRDALATQQSAIDSSMGFVEAMKALRGDFGECAECKKPFTVDDARVPRSGLSAPVAHVHRGCDIVAPCYGCHKPIYRDQETEAHAIPLLDSVSVGRQLFHKDKDCIERGFLRAANAARRAAERLQAAIRTETLGAAVTYSRTHGKSVAVVAPKAAVTAVYNNLRAVAERQAPSNAVRIGPLWPASKTLLWHDVRGGITVRDQPVPNFDHVVILAEAQLLRLSSVGPGDEVLVNLAFEYATRWHVTPADITLERNELLREEEKVGIPNG